MRCILLFIMTFGFMSCHVNGTTNPSGKLENTMKTPASIYDFSQHWVDSVYMKLTEDERIAQLFWLAIENPEKEAVYNRYLSQIDAYKPGGIILFSMSPSMASKVITEMQEHSKIPLLVSVDGENGLAMRFPGVVAFPHAMTLGAVQNDELVYQLGFEIARQCRLLGIHVNLAPVADVNVNPANPIIGTRSFGENQANVASKATAYMRGLQDGGVMAVGKHFPGHGDTDKDSHKTLPLVGKSRERLESVELFPFVSMIKSGLWGLMSAHLEVPAMEPKKGLPASFSKSILIDYLRDSLNYEGLVITDAVNMQGAKTMGRPGVVDALALAAGNDVVEFTENLPAAIKEVKKSIETGLLSWDDIEKKCKRTLAFKYYLTSKSEPVANSDSLVMKINSMEARLLNQKLFEASVTVLNNNDSVFPFIINEDEKTACLVIGNAPVFVSGFKEKFNIPVIELSTTNGKVFDSVLASTNKFSRFIVVIADSRWGRQSENSTRRLRLMQLVEKNRSVALFLGNAYHLKGWDRFRHIAGLAMVYQDTSEAQEAILNFIAGEINATGRLPVSIGEMYKAGDGFDLIF